MMKAPRRRASASTRFIGPASSATRAAAPRHQWSSHMSQTTNAVFRASQRTAFAPDADRRFRSREGAALGAGASMPAHPCIAKNRRGSPGLIL